MDLASAILNSEFVWGVVLGAVVSLAGAVVQVSLLKKSEISHQRRDIAAISIDVINNINQIVEDIVEARRRSQVIHPDLLSLIEVEIGVFGKVRENTIRLPQHIRTEVREYITNCALRRIEIGSRLMRFNQRWDTARHLYSQGEQIAAKEADDEATAIRADANRAVDDLVRTVASGQRIIPMLERLR